MSGSIAFDAIGPDGRQIWVVDDAGVGPARKLTVGTNAQSSQPTWSPDGRRIAFARYVPPSTGQIWVMNADGTNQRQLTGGPPGSADTHEYPAWSPVLLEDAPRLVFGLGKYVWPAVRAVNALLAKFGRRLRTIEVTKIAYMNSPFRVAVINADGTNQRDLWGYYPSAPGDGLEPAWSPDGTRIAFTHMVTDLAPGIWRLAVMNADGSEMMDLPVTPPGIADTNPAWKPDGTQIAFQSSRSGTRQVWTMNASGTGLLNLTNRVGDDWSPAWSPDGTKIAFASDRSGTHAIWTMNTSGGGASNVTQSLQDHACDNPAWSARPPLPTLHRA